MLISHKLYVKYNTHLVLKITEFVCYILHMICVIKIQTVENTKFLTVYAHVVFLMSDARN